MTNKVIHHFKTYDPNSLTSSGGDWNLYADGRISCTKRTRWQGQRDGQGFVMHEALSTDVTLEDFADFVSSLERDYYDLFEAGMHQTKPGHIVG